MRSRASNRIAFSALVQTPLSFSITGELLSRDKGMNILPDDPMSAITFATDLTRTMKEVPVLPQRLISKSRPRTEPVAAQPYREGTDAKKTQTLSGQRKRVATSAHS